MGRNGTQGIDLDLLGKKPHRGGSEVFEFNGG